jgi:hypothetical protein
LIGTVKIALRPFDRHIGSNFEIFLFRFWFAERVSWSRQFRPVTPALQAIPASPEHRSHPAADPVPRFFLFCICFSATS